MTVLRRFLATVALTLAVAGIANADTVRIDFETMPGADGKLGTADDVPMSLPNIWPLRNELASAGITFTAGTLFQGSFFDGNPTALPCCRMYRATF